MVDVVLSLRISLEGGDSWQCVSRQIKCAERINDDFEVPRYVVGICTLVSSLMLDFFQGLQRNYAAPLIPLHAYQRR